MQGNRVRVGPLAVPSELVGINLPFPQTLSLCAYTQARLRGRTKRTQGAQWAGEDCHALDVSRWELKGPPHLLSPCAEGEGEMEVQGAVLKCLDDRVKWEVDAPREANHRHCLTLTAGWGLLTELELVGRLRQAAMAAGKVGRGEGDVISSKTSRLKLKLKKRKGAIWSIWFHCWAPLTSAGDHLLPVNASPACLGCWLGNAQAGRLRGAGGPPGGCPNTAGQEEVGRSGWEARRSSGHGSFQQRGRGGQKTTRVLQDSTVVSGRRFLLLEVGILLHALDLGMHEWACHNSLWGKKGQQRGPRKARHVTARATKGKQSMMLTHPPRRKVQHRGIHWKSARILLSNANAATKSLHFHRLNARPPTMQQHQLHQPWFDFWIILNIFNILSACSCTVLCNITSLIRSAPVTSFIYISLCVIAYTYTVSQTSTSQNILHVPFPTAQFLCQDLMLSCFTAVVEPSQMFRVRVLGNLITVSLKHILPKVGWSHRMIGVGKDL